MKILMLCTEQGVQHSIPFDKIELIEQDDSSNKCKINGIIYNHRYTYVINAISHIGEQITVSSK